MLEFVTSHRNELIEICRTKALKRKARPATRSTEEHGVPLFLNQLTAALRLEKTQGVFSSDGIPGSGISAVAAESARMAALHGKELLDSGFSVEEVVHGYGDVCQAITELASETNAEFHIGEFHTFNRLLDNAIANAVSSYGCHLHSEETEAIERRLREECRLVNQALRALNALKHGNIGLKGTTGAILERSLTDLRDLIEKSISPTT